MKNSERGIKEQSFGAKFWKQSRNLWREGLRLRFWKSSKAPAMIQQSHSIRNFQREREKAGKKVVGLLSSSWSKSSGWSAMDMHKNCGILSLSLARSFSLSSLVCLGNWNEMGILNLEPPHKAVFTFYQYYIYMRMPKGRRI